MDMTFRGAATRLDDIDLPKIGKTIGVGEDELHAFMEVEAAGSPFDAKGRPKMLFEPHVFYRLLGAGAKRDRAVKEGLAYAKWGHKAYPKDSYPRLVKAMAIDAEKALKASSWGLSQILGQWHKEIGYATAAAMVEAFMADAEHHLSATVKLLVAWKIDDDLRAHRWEKIAEVWNGPAWRKNDYAGRMRRAFAKWQKIRDTPLEAAREEAGQARSKAGALKAPADVYASKAMITVVQARLVELGYPLGAVDGVLGALTRSSIRDFRADNGLPEGEGIDAAMAASLDTAKPRKLDPKREEAPVEKVAEKAPETAANWRTEVIAKYGAVGTVILAILDWISKQFEAGQEKLQPVIDLFLRVPGWAWFAIAVAVLLALWWHSRRGRIAGVEAFRAGARL